MQQVIFRDGSCVSFNSRLCSFPGSASKDSSKRAPRQRSKAHGSNSNSYVKRKRKKARNAEKDSLVMTYVTTLSTTTSSAPIANHACTVTSCATVPSFSPSCVGGETLWDRKCMVRTFATCMSQVKASLETRQQPREPISILDDMIERM